MKDMKNAGKDMKEVKGHWIESLYDTFILRDLFGYVAPGSLLIMGLGCELGKTEFLKEYVISRWSGIGLAVSISYLTGTGLRILGTLFPILVIHRDWFWFLFWRISIRNESDSIIKRWFWRTDKSWPAYRFGPSINDEKERERFILREDVFMHLTGNAGMALLVLAASVIVLPYGGLANHYGGLAKTLGLCWGTTVFALFSASIVFLVGHYRHAYQKVMLSEWARQDN